MSIDGHLLRLAREKLAVIKETNEFEQNEHKRIAYAKNPEIRRLDVEITRTMFGLLSKAKGADGVRLVREKSRALTAELKAALKASGFPEDYLDIHYSCEKCSDTGYHGTQMCSCLEKLYNEEKRLYLSSMLNIRDDTFEKFDLSVYSPEWRETMDTVRETCYTYAHSFGSKSDSLFFTGGTGVGKTFLSTCIAKVVSERGFSVVYGLAADVFGKFEAEKFGRLYEDSDIRNEINRYLNCDLLILDDLGTELTTSFTVSALYAIVNTRLLSGKKTIISSNIPVDKNPMRDSGDLARRYSPQIASRIRGEYQVIRFVGADVRVDRNKTDR